MTFVIDGGAEACAANQLRQDVGGWSTHPMVLVANLKQPCLCASVEAWETKHGSTDLCTHVRHMVSYSFHQKHCMHELQRSLKDLLPCQM